MKKIFIPIITTLFLLLNLSFSNTTSYRSVLNVKNIMVGGRDIIPNGKNIISGGNNVCSFTFSFSKGDRVSAAVSTLEGKLSNFNITIHNLSQGLVEKQKSLEGYRIENDGLFKIEFNNNKKVYLSINVSVKPINPEPKSFFLQKGDFYVGVSKGKKANKPDKPTFTFSNLDEGDQVTVSCDDRDGTINSLKCSHQEQNAEFWVNANSTYTVSQAKSLSLYFYLQDKTQGVIQDILRGKKDLFFENVNFTYIPKPEAYTPPDAITDATPEDPTGDYFNQLMEMEEERLLQQQAIEEEEKKRMAELLASGANSTEELMNQLSNALGISYDTIQNAVFDAPGILYDPTTALPDYVTVPPKKDLINGNRKCILLDGVMENDIWFFWFGTGSNAKEVFDGKMKAKERSSGKGITSVYTRAFKDRKIISKVNFPNEREFTENIEYALVDINNRAMFMEGKNYKPHYIGYSSSATKTEYSIFPHIKNPEADSPDELYACFCNHNKYSPMNLYFKYYVGTIEEEEVMRRNGAPSM